MGETTGQQAPEDDSVVTASDAAGMDGPTSDASASEGDAGAGDAAAVDPGASAGGTDAADAGADAGTGAGADAGAGDGATDSGDAGAGDGAADASNDAGATDTSNEADATDTSETTTAAHAGSSTDASPADDTSGSPAGDGTAGKDPGPPYLFVDLYSGDEGRLVGGHPDWSALAGTQGFCGAILKAWDGTQFNDGGWFARNWPALRDAAADRYGVSWFRGAYLFLEFLQDGLAQADAYLKAVDAAGGWAGGDILPIVDVEQGGQSHPNRKASAKQIVDCVTACAGRLREQTGRRVMLYGRSALRDLQIHDRMGCDVVWNPSWTPTMIRHGIEAWSLEEVVLWQYCGDGTAANSSLPHSVANFGTTVDISVFVKGAQRPTIQLVRDSLL